jgi:hypothetical protein
MRVCAIVGILSFTAITTALANGFEADNCGKASDPKMCRAQQESLMPDWPKANSGDYQAQRNVAYCLKNTCDGAIKRDLVSGCAWRIIIKAADNAKFDGDIQNFRYDCGALNETDLRKALMLATELYKKIYKQALPIERVITK